MSRLGVLGLWTLVTACSGSTTALNRQPVDNDGGGNTTSTGGTAGNVGEGGPSSGGTGVAGQGGTGGVLTGTGGTFGTVTTSKKLDVLIMVDNSSSMADKQAVLAATLPDLTARLSAVESLHVGVITSSLGSHGTPACEETEDHNDHGRLLGSRPRASSLGLQNGFIDWTPADGAPALAGKIQGLVRAAGQSGCGLEAQFESIYRFLADPFPPENIVLAPCQGNAECATPQGIDSEILAQRQAFLRPDSALAIVMLTDENDCSIRDESQFFYAAKLDVLLPAASTACDTNPNDPCCYSCGIPKPAECTQPADPKCGPPPPSLTAIADQGNLRCFDQKRRFGIDFLYPVQRYVNALQRQTLCITSPDLQAPATGCKDRPDGSPGEVPNPIFVNTIAPDQIRSPSMVHVLGILGAPWQALSASSDENGDPYPTGELHYQSPSQLDSMGTWAAVLGNQVPGGDQPPVLPTDSHMIESPFPRAGLAGPGTGYMADTINGHEWNISRADDLQYACIFPLPTALSPCSDANCDCFNRDPGSNNPLCQTPSGTYEAVQYFGKAYPGLRELTLVKELGGNAVAASICPRNLTDLTAQDYGYRPAVEALVKELAKSVR